MNPSETSARRTPIWTVPLMLAVLGILLFVGRLSPLLAGIVGGETALAAGYLILRARRPAERPPSNVVSLFPGHLLLLLAVSLLPDPDGLAGLWAVIPVVSIAYDLTAANVRKGRLRTSILIGLYAILWAAVFALLERIIAIGRGLGRGEEAIAAVALGTFGILFVSLGIHRHWRAGKE